MYKENLNLQSLCVYKEPEPSVLRSILRTWDMVLQNRLDLNDSQRLSQRPGAYFLFRVLHSNTLSVFTVNYILCTICTVYCQYVLSTIYCVPYQCTVSMYCQLYILCTICTVYCQYVLQWTIYCVPYVQCTVSMYCQLYFVYHMYSVLSVCTAVNYIVCTICTVYWVQAWYFYINLPSRNDDKCSV